MICPVCGYRLSILAYYYRCWGDGTAECPNCGYCGDDYQRDFNQILLFEDDDDDDDYYGEDEDDY